MKHMKIVLSLAAAVLLTGCSSLLEEEYHYITPHNAAPTTEGNSSTLRAGNYQELVNALIYLIDNTVEKGTIRLYTDSEDVETDLENACLEVVQEDPLGAYAVEYINYSINSVVSYREATVDITYRRTKEQVDSIVQSTGSAAIRNELAAAMSAFRPECVLRISYFEEDEAFIQNLAVQAYYSIPASAFGMPDVQVFLYPDNGQQRIVEILLDYPLDQKELEQRQSAVNQWMEELTRQLSTSTGDAQIQAAAQAIFTSGRYSPEGASTPYALLDEGQADSEGFSLAFAALCQRLNLPCKVVAGSKDGQPHCWNLVRSSDGWQHLDLSVSSQDTFPLYSDQDMKELGYEWDPAVLPSNTASADHH